MSPLVYLKTDEEKGKGFGLIDLDALSFNVCKIMLDLPLHQYEWELDGKANGLSEPLAPREAGENMAEWHFKQVMPEAGWPEMEYRAADMTLSIIRAAFRHAKDVGVKHVSIRMQRPSQNRPYLGLARRGVIIPTGSVQLLVQDEAAQDLTLEFI